MQQSLAGVQGEHYLVVEAELSVGQVLERMRDHRCQAAIFQQDGAWKVFSAQGLAQLLLTGPEALKAPVSSQGQPVHRLAEGSAVGELGAALRNHAWVAVGSDQPAAVFNWSSWARYCARYQIAQDYTFSPESGRADATPAAVKA